MTAILGYADGTHAWLGGDSASISGWTHYQLKGRKVFRLFDEMLIGVAGKPRLAQIIRYTLPDRSRPDGWLAVDPTVDPEEYLVRCFLPELQKALEAGKFDWQHEDNNSSALLIGLRGTLYECTSSGNLSANGNGVAGLGAGAEYAIGAFEGYRSSRGSIEAAMLAALEVAGKYSGAVLPPYYVEKL